MIVGLHKTYEGGVYAGGKIGWGFGVRDCSPRYVAVGIPFDATSIRGDTWTVLDPFLTVDPPAEGVADELWHRGTAGGQRMPICAAVALVCITGLGWDSDGLHVSGTVLECHTLDLYAVEPGRETDIAPGEGNLTDALAKWLGDKYPGVLDTFRAGFSEWEDRTKARPRTDFPADSVLVTARDGDGNIIGQHVTTPDGEHLPVEDITRLADDGNPLLDA